ncbi:hypothetical protein BGZ75_003693 [Mortierella antarctica]|nr:hypothetical protein BGZ75_003693 [Mortierella antarctica]
MPKRGAKQGGRGGKPRGGGRGGHSNRGGGGRGGGGGGGGGRRGYDIDFYDDGQDDFISLTGRHQQYRQQSTEGEIYARIQKAKGGRGGGRSGEGYPSSSGSRGHRNGGAGGYRPPPPPPKQNSNGKNSKHVFWPHPDYNTNHGPSSNVSQRGGRSRNGGGPRGQVLFNRATDLSNPAIQDQDSDDDEDDDDDDINSDEEDDSSDDMLDRGIDSEDESDEECLMQQFNWIEEEQDQVGSSTSKEPAQHAPVTLHQLQQQAALSGAPLRNGAMTQSEDFLQAMEAEDTITTIADEIDRRSTPLSTLSDQIHGGIHTQTDIVQSTEVAVDLSSADIVMATPEEEEPLPWFIDTTPDVIVAPRVVEPTITLPLDLPLPANGKPKKKAHRSKRGGKNQREKQTNKQLVVGHDDDGLIFLENPSDEEDDDMLAMEDYLENTMNDDDDDDDGPHQYASLLGALKGLHAGGPGHFKDIGGINADDSDYEQQASEDKSQDEEDEFDFELDYEDGIRKLDFSKVSTSMNDKRKNRKADDLLREELQDLMPLWRSGALGDGDGANRRFKSRAKGYDMYDSDNEFIASSMTGGKKQKKNKKEPHGGSFESLMDINRSIENFVKDRTSDNLQLPPMPKPLRRKVHLLCNHYNLKSQSVGSGKRRFPILIKTDRTKMPINPVNINKLLNQSEKELTMLSAQFQGSRKGGNGNNGGGGGGKGKGKSFGGGGGGGSMAAPHGTVVGASASAISGENLGHRMLSKMGWSPGVGLGATGDGITQPIEAVVRAKRRGLGHE